MAVIWKTKKGYKIYVTPSGAPPTSEEIELAKEYEKKLQEKINEIIVSLRKRGFFNMQNKMKKWYMLGKELQFLDSTELRIKCDPNFKNTWRALYDLAPRLAPTENIPTDEERATGWRNHFYVSYRLAKLPWALVQNIPWGNWTDINAAFSPEMWEDGRRLLEWVVSRASTEKGINRKKLRKALKALRGVAGQRAKVARDTTVLSKEELYKLLDQKLKLIEQER